VKEKRKNVELLLIVPTTSLVKITCASLQVAMVDKTAALITINVKRERVIATEMMTAMVT